MSKRVTGLHSLFEQKQPLVLDGGLSNVLLSMGADLKTSFWCAELLVSDRDMIRQAHLHYLEAGADIITSCTYQASMQGFANLGISETQSRQYMLDSIRLMEEARARYFETHPVRPVYLAASLGPYGAFMADGSEYTGVYDVSDSTLKDFHRARLDALDSAGQDFYAFETIPMLREAEIIAELLTEAGSDCWVSFSCESGTILRDGNKLSEAVQVLKDIPGVFALGVNCVDPAIVSTAIQVIKTSAPDKKVVVYPNAGQQYDAVSKSWSKGGKSVEFTDSCERWIHEGASIVGGCCEIGCHEIRALAEKQNP